MTLLILPFRLFASEHVTCSLRFECDMFQQRFIRIYLLLIQSESLYAQHQLSHIITHHRKQSFNFTSADGSDSVQHLIQNSLEEG